jgi:3-oxoacyl-[acyl-carrier protein] reductase
MAIFQARPRINLRKIIQQGRRMAGVGARMNEKKLTGKAALISGGSRGIGAATAARLAHERADVAISYGSSAEQAEQRVKETEKSGVPGLAFAAAQSDQEQTIPLVESVKDALGRLDILVNNGALYMTCPVHAEDADLEVFTHQFDTNVRGVVAITRAAVRVMGEGGRIVSMSTASADGVPFPGIGDHSATKAAVTAYTPAWARDLEPRSIPVNAVQTSSVSTDMKFDAGPLADAQRSRIRLDRFGQPDEIGRALTFPVGPDASFVMGATLNVDGGFNA